MGPKISVSMNDLAWTFPPLKLSLRNENMHHTPWVVWSLSSNSKGLRSSRKRGQSCEMWFFVGKGHRTSLDGEQGYGLDKREEGKVNFVLDGSWWRETWGISCGNIRWKVCRRGVSKGLRVNGVLAHLGVGSGL